MLKAQYSIKIEGLNEEIKKRIDVVEQKIPTSLQIVGSDMQNSLLTHLHLDWYTKYKPKQYQRRTDNPDLGIAITDTDTMTISVAGNNLEFDYFPTGYTKQPIDLPLRNGDDLIEWIQSAHSDIPARPFWNNFVLNQEDYAVSSFIEAMKSTQYKIVKDDNDRLNLSEFLLADNGVTTTDSIETNGENNMDDDIPY